MKVHKILAIVTLMTMSQMFFASYSPPRQLVDMLDGQSLQGAVLDQTTGSQLTELAINVNDATANQSPMNPSRQWVLLKGANSTPIIATELQTNLQNLPSSWVKNGMVIVPYYVNQSNQKVDPASISSSNTADAYVAIYNSGGVLLYNSKVSSRSNSNYLTNEVNFPVAGQHLLANMIQASGSFQSTDGIALGSGQAGFAVANSQSQVNTLVKLASAKQSSAGKSSSSTGTSVSREVVQGAGFNTTSPNMKDLWLGVFADGTYYSLINNTGATGFPGTSSTSRVGSNVPVKNTTSLTSSLEALEKSTWQKGVYFVPFVDQGNLYMAAYDAGENIIAQGKLGPVNSSEPQLDWYGCYLKTYTVSNLDAFGLAAGGTYSLHPTFTTTNVPNLPSMNGSGISQKIEKSVVKGPGFNLASVRGGLSQLWLGFVVEGTYYSLANNVGKTGAPPASDRQKIIETTPLTDALQALPISTWNSAVYFVPTVNNGQLYMTAYDSSENVLANGLLGSVSSDSPVIHWWGCNFDSSPVTVSNLKAFAVSGADYSSLASTFTITHQPSFTPSGSQATFSQSINKPVVKSKYFGVGVQNANTQELWLGFTVGSNFYTIADNLAVNKSAVGAKVQNVKYNYISEFTDVFNAASLATWQNGVYFVPVVNDNKLYLFAYDNNKTELAKAYICEVDSSDVTLGWWGSYMAQAPIQVTDLDVFGVAIDSDLGNIENNFSVTASMQADSVPGSSKQHINKSVKKFTGFQVSTNNTSTNALWLGCVVGDTYYELANNTKAGTPGGATQKVVVSSMQKELNSLSISTWKDGVYFVPVVKEGQLYVLAYDHNDNLLTSSVLGATTSTNPDIHWWGSYIPNGINISNLEVLGLSVGAGKLATQFDGHVHIQPSLGMLHIPADDITSFSVSPIFGKQITDLKLISDNVKKLVAALKNGAVLVRFATQASGQNLNGTLTVTQGGNPVLSQTFNALKDQNDNGVAASSVQTTLSIGYETLTHADKPIVKSLGNISTFVASIGDASSGAAGQGQSHVLASGEKVDAISLFFDFKVMSQEIISKPIKFNAESLQMINEKLAFGSDVTISGKAVKNSDGWTPSITATAGGAPLFTWPSIGTTVSNLKTKIEDTLYDIDPIAVPQGQSVGYQTSNMIQMKELSASSEFTFVVSKNAMLSGPSTGGHSSGSSSKSKGGLSVTGAEAIIKANMFDGSSAVATALKKDMYIASDWNSDILPALKSISYPEKDIAAVAKALGVSYTPGSQSSGSSSSGSSKSSGVPSGLSSLIVKGNQQATINALRSGSSGYSTAQIRSALSKAGFSGGQTNYIMSQVA